MEHKEWDFESGHLVLDFTNTAEFHASDDPDEMLETYPKLVSWAQAAGLLTRKESRAILIEADQNPKFAARSLRKAIDLRERIYSILTSAAQGGSPSEADLNGFNQHLSERAAAQQDRLKWRYLLLVLGRGTGSIRQDYLDAGARGGEPDYIRRN